MADSDWSTELARFGYAFQQKFDFYFVALTFTILGLAVQTATFGTQPVADCFELLGWLSLLVSGIAGIHRLQWQPQVFQLWGVQTGQENRLTGLRKAKAQGTRTVHTLETGSDISIDEVIANDEKGLSIVKQRIDTVQGHADRGHSIRSFTFLLGLAALIIARGLSPFLHLINTL